MINIKIYDYYYTHNTEAIKEKSRECYKNLSQEEKLKNIKRKSITNWFNIKKMR